jgi:hypothetical protein
MCLKTKHLHNIVPQKWNAPLSGKKEGALFEDGLKLWGLSQTRFKKFLKSFKILVDLSTHIENFEFQG